MPALLCKLIINCPPASLAMVLVKLHSSSNSHGHTPTLSTKGHSGKGNRVLSFTNNCFNPVQSRYKS